VECGVISSLVAFIGALLLSVLLTPAVRRFALEIGAVDSPGERRVHQTVIPRMGGIAIAAAFFLPLICLFAFETAAARVFFEHPMRMVGLTLGGLLVCGIGVLDDLRGVRASHKLLVQILAGAVAYLCGFRIDAVWLPFVGHLDMGVFGLLVTTLWVVAITNAINLIDGLDGLAGGVAFFACITNFVVAGINQDAAVLLLSASLGGALLGFLLYNFNPATIFMGDSGSMFLGYVLGTTSILGNAVRSSTTIAILVPLIALGLPLIDTLFAMVRRFLERRPIFAADRGHIHHRLLALGLTHRRAVLTLYALSIMFTAGAIIVSIGRNWQIGAALAVLSVMVVGVIRAMGNFQVAMRRWRRHERVRPGTVERFRIAVPPLLQRISASREVSDLKALLEDFGALAQLAAIELVGSEAAPLPAFTWLAEDQPAPTDPTREQVVTAAYPLAAAGAKASLRFAWLTDAGEVTSESDILLQLVADACEARINRVEGARSLASKGHLRSLQ
jgi:UDP-GlcNAc:undecaprenyl-phosphate GlcNAc-1-phosphate transferase